MSTKSHRRRRPEAKKWPFHWWALAALGVALSLVIVVLTTNKRSRIQTAGIADVRVPASTPARARKAWLELSDDQLTKAIDRLFLEMHPGRGENRDLPPYAREKLRWMYDEVAAGRLQISLLSDLSRTNLTAEDLMASGDIDGRHTLIVAKPRFLELLAEGPGPDGPFTEEQRNDFMLGAVHEVVHLQNNTIGDPKRVGSVRAEAEEVRVWREVDLNVVRPLLARGAPVHSRFVQVDAAFRACGDRLDCRPASIIGP